MPVRRLAILLLAAFLTGCLPSPRPATPTPSPLPAWPTAPPSPTPPPPSPSPTPSDLHLTHDDILLYPAPNLYSGDQVTFDITPRNLGPIDPADLTVRVYHSTTDGPQAVAEGQVGYPAFDGVPRARLVWAWNTAGLEGTQRLTIRLDPDDVVHQGDEDPHNNAVDLVVRLLPADERPPLEVAASWTSTRTHCCEVHYLTGTAAERDLLAILDRLEAAADTVEARLGVGPGHPYSIYMASRVIAHGGYARGPDHLVVSYLDRHYAGRNLDEVVRHEMVHVVDSAAISQRAPALLREGLAVWVTGGHYKPEPIRERAAALFRQKEYIPLRELADRFYSHQHEIGYVEAAALVGYLSDTYGWDRFLRFYRGLDTFEGNDVEVIDAALQESFGAGLDAVEAGFRQWLQDTPASPEQEQDLRISVRLFDLVRRYQQTYEPGAYFASGWLPDPVEAERRGIVADFLRHPRAPENIALEAMLIAAQEAVGAGDYRRAEGLVEAVEAILDGEGFTAPPAADFLSIVQAVGAAGYEAQTIDLQGDSATVRAIRVWPALKTLTLTRTPSGWTLPAAAP